MFKPSHGTDRVGHTQSKGHGEKRLSSKAMTHRGRRKGRR